MGEMELVRSIQGILSLKGIRIFRNQVGLAKVRGGYVMTGLGVGSPDLVGWRKVLVTPEMVGSHVAVFVGVEVKDGSHGKVSEDQVEFLGGLRGDGGIGILARSEEDVVGI